MVRKAKPVRKVRSSPPPSSPPPIDPGGIVREVLPLAEELLVAVEQYNRIAPSLGFNRRAPALTMQVIHQIQIASDLTDALTRAGFGADCPFGTPCVVYPRDLHTPLVTLRQMLFDCRLDHAAQEQQRLPQQEGFAAGLRVAVEQLQEASDICCPAPAIVEETTPTPHDGAIAPDLFRWKGQQIRDLTTPQWRLLARLSREGVLGSVPLAEAVNVVYGGRFHLPDNPERAIEALVRRIQARFDKVPVRVRLAFSNGYLQAEEDP